MKKTILTLLSIAIMTATASFVCAKSPYTQDVAEAIKLYKAQNYTQCYTKLHEILKKDSTNPLAHYYLAMTAANLGKKGEAIDNYEKAEVLSTPGSTLNRYAAKGKLCTQDPSRCSEEDYESADEAFIVNKVKQISDEARSKHEKLKIENMMREINRSEDIPPQEFREFRDFSSMNKDGIPTNDEIVAAIRTLQKAGLGSIVNNGYSSDISTLLGNNNNQSMLLNMMGSQNMNPQLIQTLLTNNMSLGF